MYVVNGIGGDYSISSIPKVRPYLRIKMQTIANNSQKLMNGLGELANNPELFQKSSIKGILQEELHKFEESLSNVREGYFYCQLRANANSLYLNEIWQGISHIDFLLKILGNLNINILYQKLTRLKKKIFIMRRPQLIFTCTESDFCNLEYNNFFGFEIDSSKKFSPLKEGKYSGCISSHALVIPSPTAYNCLSISCPRYFSDPFVGLLISCQLLRAFLFNSNSGNGGAYFLQVNYHAFLEKFSLISGSDPHIYKTFCTFKELLKSLVQGKFTLKELEGAKIAAVRQLTASSGNLEEEGYHVWASLHQGRTMQSEKLKIQQIMSAKKIDVQRAVKEHLLTNLDESTFVTFANRELIDREEQLFRKKGMALPIFEFL